MLSDEYWMEQAILVGEKGRINAPPNPWVGCILVKDNRIVGSGYHAAAGKSHAETIALSTAKSHAKESTAYVTLEPCCHYGKTPPCVKALAEAGVSRVVIALQDPDPLVNGKGIEFLKKAKISVTVGVLKEKATASLIPYLYHRKTGQAFCVAKGAISIDGRTAAEDGSSQWITTPESNVDAHQLRAESQAILVGSNTAIMDQPLLTVREGAIPEKQPLRVVLDASGKVEFLKPTDAPTLIITSEKCPLDRIRAWKSQGFFVEILPLYEEAFSPKEILQLLGKKNILQVMVEGGSIVLGSFLKAGQINRLIIYVGPRILGDKGYPLFKNLPYTSLEQTPVLQLISSKILGDNVRMEWALPPTA